MRFLIAASLAWLVAASAVVAEESYPDIVGTWKGEGIAVALGSDGSPASFYSEEVTQVVTEQRDRRFVGRMFSGEGAEQFLVHFVGIFLDQDRFRWSEPNGFVEGRLINADTIDSCYTRTGAENQAAACQILKRQK